eukprot:TRINITY_DN508_c0_g9_i1.p1 TRINITY_DN508_c0_g9~~TRINITY_DN508_c0_g9_i1.p1  ORF type:complete len:217 (-),score=26.95 TRINITY_DN508_c0_g9_i1:57-668(-)
MPHSLLLLLLAVVLAAACSDVASAAACPDVATVDINTTSYLGVWYEIATSPLAKDTFERDCYCTHANYTAESADSLNVFNTCNKDSVNGTLSLIHGTATIANASEPGKLSVSFGGPPGPYWIIMLDPSYEWVVVWSCTDVLGLQADIMWVLSRTPTLDSTLFTKITTQAANMTGYDVSKLEMTTQDGCQDTNVETHVAAARQK